MNDEPLNGTGDDATREPEVADVLRWLREDRADLLYLAAVAREYPATAAQALQQLETERRLLADRLGRVDPAEIRRAHELEASGT